MAFYSQLFWVSMFMQQLENLNSFEVAVRLLPQALVGLLLSPLVGLFMHAIPGTGLLAFAASSLVLSNIFLIFLRPDSHYLLWIFPSLMLSTIGMDWVMNVGSVRLKASPPLIRRKLTRCSFTYCPCYHQNNIQLEPRFSKRQVDLVFHLALQSLLQSGLLMTEKRTGHNPSLRIHIRSLRQLRSPVFHFY